MGAETLAFKENNSAIIHDAKEKSLGRCAFQPRSTLYQNAVLSTKPITTIELDHRLQVNNFQ